MRTSAAFLWAGLAAALVLAGCGEDLTCGPGTHAEDGVCVQNVPMDCDPETAELVDGVCKAKQVGATCGPGTKQNPYNPTECVPDCGAGTVLDPVTKKCVPENSIVQPDIVEQPSDEDNDPMNDGVPISFTLPGLNGQIVLGGVIGAPTSDGAGGFFADFDGWKFSTTGPTLLEIEGIAVAQIRVAFFLSPANEPFALQRFGFDAEGGQAKRRLFIPTAGDWVLIVSDADNFNALWYGAQTMPVGADDSTFNYAVRITNMALPAYDNLAPNTPMVGSYSAGPRFYSLNPTVGQIVEFWNVPDGDEVYPATEFLSPETTYKKTSFSPLTLARATGQTLFFVADLAGAMTPNLSVTYMATLATPESLGTLPGPLGVTGATIDQQGGSRYYAFNLTGTGLISVNATAPSSSSMSPVATLYDAALNFVPLSAGFMPPAFVELTSAAEFIVQVMDEEGGGGTGYTFDLSVTGGPATPTAEVEPNDTAAQATAGTGMPVVFSGALSNGTDKDFYQFTLPADANLVLTIAADAATGPDTLLELYDSTGTTKIAENDDANGFGCMFGYFEYCLSRIDRTAQAAGTYVVAVSTPYNTPGPYKLIVIAE